MVLWGAAMIATRAPCPAGVTGSSECCLSANAVYCNICSHKISSPHAKGIYATPFYCVHGEHHDGISNILLLCPCPGIMLHMSAQAVACTNSVHISTHAHESQGAVWRIFVALCGMAA